MLTFYIVSEEKPHPFQHLRWKHPGVSQGYVRVLLLMRERSFQKEPIWLIQSVSDWLTDWQSAYWELTDSGKTEQLPWQQSSKHNNRAVNMTTGQYSWVFCLICCVNVLQMIILEKWRSVCLLVTMETMRRYSSIQSGSFWMINQPVRCWRC